MRLLDLFCCAGGGAMGYWRAGFTEIVGVDIRPQKRYPFKFVLGDALDYVAAHGHEFDFIHASPPCQEYSALKTVKRKTYADLVAPTRRALLATGKPYAIENVVGAPLINPLMLCGSMFGLRVQRHRLFETNPLITFSPFSCQHWGRASGMRPDKHGHRPRRTLSNFAFLTICGFDFLAEEGRKAMGIDWMVKSELSQAIPPAYTEWLGRMILGIIK